jgi:predicted nucleic acid-binding protein
VILVDTSVWVEAFRRADRQEAGHLRVLLDAGEVAMTSPVRIEILSGSRATDLPQLRRTLSALPLFVPGVETWGRVEGWVERALRAGRRFGPADLLIAAVAAENDLSVWSLDRDFAEMAKLGFVRVHEA